MSFGEHNNPVLPFFGFFLELLVFPPLRGIPGFFERFAFLFQGF